MGCSSLLRQRDFCVSGTLEQTVFAALQRGSSAVQHQCQQDAQHDVNAAVLLEQYGGGDDGHAEHGGGRAHPAAAGLVKDAAAVVSHHQRHRVEDVDGRADVGGRVGVVEPAHRPGEEVRAVHTVRAEIQPIGDDDIHCQRDGHAREQGKAEPPEVGAGRFPQQIEQGERDPDEPCKIGDDRIFAEGDQIVQPAVDPDFGHGDVDFEPVEHREIKHKIKRHEPDGMAGKPASHGTHFLFLELGTNGP